MTLRSADLISIQAYHLLEPAFHQRLNFLSSAVCSASSALAKAYPARVKAFQSISPKPSKLNWASDVHRKGSWYRSIRSTNGHTVNGRTGNLKDNRLHRPTSTLTRALSPSSVNPRHGSLAHHIVLEIRGIQLVDENLNPFCLPLGCSLLLIPVSNSMAMKFSGVSPSEIIILQLICPRIVRHQQFGIFPLHDSAWLSADLDFPAGFGEAS